MNNCTIQIALLLVALALTLALAACDPSRITPERRAPRASPST